MEVRWGAMTTGGTFQYGDPLSRIDAGTLTFAPQDVTQWIIGDFSATGTITFDGGIALAGPKDGDLPDFRTGTTYAAGAMIPYVPINNPQQQFIAKLTAAGGGALAAPAVTDIGESYQMSYATANGAGTSTDLGWCVEQTAGAVGTDVCAFVNDVLDAQYVSLNEPSNDGTGVYCVFTITATTAAA